MRSNNFLQPRLVLIGFHATSDGLTPESQNEIIGRLLGENGYDIRSASAKQNQIARLCDQIWTVMRSCRWADALVVDVFSARRLWTPFLLARVARFLNLPLVLVLHGGGLADYAKAFPRRVDSTLGVASVVVAPSSFLKREFEARGFTVLLVPNLVDLPVPEPHSEPKKHLPAILWMRAFDHEYQPVLAIEAFSRLCVTYGDALLTMAGPDRGLLDEAKAAAKAIGLEDRIQFPGYLEQKEKMTALTSHDLFLNTTAIDNTPVSVLEALSAGLPVVTTDVGGMADLLEDGRAGILVRGNDSEALANAMDQILSDDGLRTELVTAGREVAGGFRPESVLSAWKSVFVRLGVETHANGRDGIRPLSLSDLDDVVAIHCEAFPNSVMTQLGRGVVRRYYSWQFVGPHPNPLAIGAWQDGRLVGFLFGGTRKGAVSGFARTSLPTLAWGALTHPRAVTKLSASKITPVVRLAFRMPIRDTSSSPPFDESTGLVSVAEPSLGLLSLAVTKRAQGSNIAGSLIVHLESQAIEMNYRGMHLSVNKSNARAIAFYKKHGWQISRSEGEGAVLMVKVLETG